MYPGTIFAGVAALGLALAPVAAGAQELKAEAIFKSGQQLLDQCTALSSEEVAACDWYIMGAWDAFGLLADLEITQRYMCRPDGTEAGELRAEVIGYLQRSSTDLSKSAISNVVNAIMEADPCPEL